MVIQLTIAISFISSKDNDKGIVRHSKSDNIEIMINDKADEFIEERFESLLKRYQIGLETLMKGNVFVFVFLFVCVSLLHCKCHRINLKRSGSYLDSLLI